MRTRDRRSFRVALVADRFLNPPRRGLDLIPILLEAGWGVIQLPADDYASEIAQALLEQVAEQAEEFHRRGYDVVVIGGRAGLDEALARVGVAQLDRVDPATAKALQAFLRKRRTPRTAASSTRPRARAKTGS